MENNAGSIIGFLEELVIMGANLIIYLLIKHIKKINRTLLSIDTWRHHFRDVLRKYIYMSLRENTEDTNRLEEEQNSTPEIENREDLVDREVLKSKLETEFPLSGGETEADWEAVTNTTSEDTTEEETEEDEIEEDVKPDEQEFKRRLEDEYPLSGGEV
jgi:hypothetical protein